MGVSRRQKSSGQQQILLFKGLEWMQFFLVCSCKECGICTLPRDLSIVGSIIHQWICRELYTSTYVTPYWCIDFDESDVGFLQNTGIMQTLEKFFSLRTLKSCQASYARIKKLENLDNSRNHL